MHAPSVEDLGVEEFSRISDAIRSRKFPEVMKDYLTEVSDPSNSQEHRDYLLQLEKDGEVPDGMTILWLSNPVVIARTFLVREDEWISRKTPLYIQVCPSEKLGNSTSSEGMPMLISPLHPERDPKKSNNALCGSIEVVVPVSFRKRFLDDLPFVESVLNDVRERLISSMSSRNSNSGVVVRDFRLVSMGPPISPMLVKSSSLTT